MQSYVLKMVPRWKKFQCGIHQNFISCVCLFLSAHTDRHQFIANLTPINTFASCQERKLKFSPFHQLSLPVDTHSNSHFFSPCSFASTAPQGPHEIISFSNYSRPFH
ncbi:hypothetical protein ILYODFUR_033490 [Ilyodon furcidens]|uniref:Uncharacterized protein n=1 Tax=Ilyodon furcidens TaxID=33524 RepID=A0ABV0TZW5_9TELE